MGGLDRSVDRKNVIIYRKFLEGIKKAQIDLTREDLQNSPYFWLQNGRFGKVQYQSEEFLWFWQRTFTDAYYWSFYSYYSTFDIFIDN